MLRSTVGILFALPALSILNLVELAKGQESSRNRSVDLTLDYTSIRASTDTMNLCGEATVD